MFLRTCTFLLLFLGCMVAYWPAMHGSLLWDDAGHITHPLLRSADGLRRIWFEPGTTQQYYPLLHSAFWLEHQLWGDATQGYHLVNVLWHSLSACLLIELLRRLKVPGAFLAGLVFALHPVAVESVAWISEQKNTLSTLLYLAAALAWLRHEEDRRPRNYLVATLWFIAALASKTVTATLPAALLVLAWWRRGRLSWRTDIAPLLPWLLLGVAAGLGTAWMEVHEIGAKGDDFTLGGVERVLLAGRIVWFYLGKLLWPSDLAFFYARWSVDATVLWQWLYPVAALGLLLGLWLRRNKERALLAAALLYGGTLVPVLGIVNVYPFVFSYVADHFQYLASLSVISVACAAAVLGFGRLCWPRWSGILLAVALLLTLAHLTWRQSAHYRDVITLYRETLERTPSSWVANLNLGVALADAGQVEQSLPYLQRALELKPGFTETLNSLGNVLNRLGRPREARPLLEEALRRQPRYAQAHNTLGASLMATGNAVEGIESFRKAIELEPTLTLARVNLGWALANAGKLAEALDQFAQAHKLDPESAELEFKWGLSLAMHRRTSEALPHFQRAADLQPDNPDRHHMLGICLLDTGDPEAAALEFETTLELAPGHPGARQTLQHLRGGAR